MAPRPYRMIKRVLRMEPYDPDAKDADGDGIVQEGTAWERPGGTRLVDRDGRDMRRGSTAEGRPSGLRVVGRDGRPVEYTPSYDRQQVQPALRNRYGVAGTIRERLGTIGDRPEAPPEPDPDVEVAEPDPTRITVAERIRSERAGDRGLDVAAARAREERVLAAWQRGAVGQGEVTDAMAARRRAEAVAALPEGAVLREWADTEEALDRVAPTVKRRPDGATAEVKRGEVLGEGPLGVEYRADIAPGGVLWRGVTGEDFERIVANGEIDSEGRGAIGGRAEGVNLSEFPQTGVSYLPSGSEGVVLAIDADRVPEPFLLNDGYIRTRKPIPISAIVDVSEPMGKTSRDAGQVGYWPRDWRDRADGSRVMVADSVLDEAARRRGVGEERRRSPGDSRMDDRGGSTMNAIDEFDVGRREVQLFGQSAQGVDRAARYAAERDADPRRSPSRDRERLDGFLERAAGGAGQPPRRPRPPRDAGDDGEVPNPPPRRPGPPEPPRKPFAPMRPSPPAFSGKALALAEQADGDWGRFQELLDAEGYVVLDYETTGLDDTDVPVQVGAIVMRDGKEVGRFNMWMDAGRLHESWSDWSRGEAGPQSGLRRENGELIDQAFLDEQMSDVEVHQQLKDFLDQQVGEDPIIVAHNLPFDQRFLERSMTRAGFDEFKVTSGLDTLQLMRDAIPRKRDGVDGPTSHRLGDIAGFLKVDFDEANLHRADQDAEVTNGLLRRGLAKAAERRADPDILTGRWQRARVDRETEAFEKAQVEHAQRMVAWRRALVDHQAAKEAYDRQRAEGVPDEDVVLPEPRPDVRVFMPDRAELHGIDRLDESGVENPAWVALAAQGAAAGVPIRGVPISPLDERLPDTLYHVTMDADVAKVDGLVRTDVEGRPNPSGDRTVVLTLDQSRAVDQASDIELMAKAAETQSLDGFMDVLRADLGAPRSEDGGAPLLAEEWREVEDAYDEFGPAQAFEAYLSLRSTAGGRRHPRFQEMASMFEGMRNRRPNIAVVEVPRENLATGALLTGASQRGALWAVRLHGDLPLDQGARIRADEAWRNLRNADGVLATRRGKVPMGRLAEADAEEVREWVATQRERVVGVAATATDAELADLIKNIGGDQDGLGQLAGEAADAWQRGDDEAAATFAKWQAMIKASKGVMARLRYERFRAEEPMDRQERIAAIRERRDPVVGSFVAALSGAEADGDIARLRSVQRSIARAADLYATVTWSDGVTDFDAERAEALVEELTALEPAANAAVLRAEARQRASLNDLGDFAETRGRPGQIVPSLTVRNAEPPVPWRGLPSDLTDAGSRPKRILNPEIKTLEDALEHVDAGGSLDEVPNALWPDVLTMTTSYSDLDGETLFVDASKHDGAEGVVSVHRVRDQGGPTLQGYVLKADRRPSAIAREVAGWNMAVDHGLPVEGAMWVGDRQAVLPHAANGAPSGTDSEVIGTDWGDNWSPSIFEDLPDRGLPQRMSLMLQSYLTNADDMHEGNGIGMVVDGEPLAVRIDYSRQDRRLYSPFMEYMADFNYDNAFHGGSNRGRSAIEEGDVHELIRLNPDSEESRRLAGEVAGVYDGMLNRAEQVIRQGRDAFVDRMIHGHPVLEPEASPTREQENLVRDLQKGLGELFDQYELRAEMLRDAREDFLNWLRYGWAYETMNLEGLDR